MRLAPVTRAAPARPLSDAALMLINAAVSYPAVRAHEGRWPGRRAVTCSAVDGWSACLANWLSRELRSPGC
jgi:hypothetical protein